MCLKIRLKNSAGTLHTMIYIALREKTRKIDKNQEKSKKKVDKF